MLLLFIKYIGLCKSEDYSLYTVKHHSTVYHSPKGTLGGCD